MIGEVLALLRDQLDDHLAAVVGARPTDSREPLVVLIDGDKMDPIDFKLNAISALLVNLEEDTSVRPDDPYRRTLADGTQVRVVPPLRLNLYVLFAARFRQYDQGLGLLTAVIGYFQRNRVLDHRNTPALNRAIDKLVLELVTLPFSEVNEVWSALRTTYLPSVLYRVRLVAVEDQEAAALATVADVDRRIT